MGVMAKRTEKNFKIRLVKCGEVEPIYTEQVIEDFFYDAAGNEITEEQWEQLYTDFISGKEVLNEGLKWSEMNYAEAVAASDEALLRMLAETMKAE